MSILDRVSKQKAQAPEGKKLFGVVAGPRLGGKCLKEGTLVHTITGPKAIETIQPGEMVYGYNSDGTVSPTAVLSVVNQGTKEVVDLLYANKVIATATREHRWLTRGKNTRVGTTAEVFSYRDIERRFVPHQGGDITFPQAYSLGVLLGNGCARQGSGTRFDISSAEESMIAAVARQLGGTYKSNSDQNYTWNIFVKSVRDLSYYQDWVMDRYSYEKVIDLDEVRTWDRRSQVALLAGLIDTDGSVSYSPAKTRSLTLSFSSTSRSLADAVQYLILSLFQTRAAVRIDSREDSRDCYDVRVNSGFHTVRMLQELDEFIQSPQKKMRPEYETFPHQRNPEVISVSEGSCYVAQCWDLMVDNDTSLYLLTNEGLITHNTTLAATLPGKTLMLQAAVLESGSKSAEKLASDLGTDLTVLTFKSLSELDDIIKELKSDETFDNVYVDGLSALTELKYNDPAVQRRMKANVWDGYKDIGDYASAVIMELKSLTYFDIAKKPKNVFLTCALSIKMDKSGGIADVGLETKGNMAVTAITKLGEAVVTVMMVPGESGAERKLITKTADWWPGRIDGVLDDQNPGQMEPDLTKLLKLIQG